jgi:hypothetical protein
LGQEARNQGHGARGQRRRKHDVMADNLRKKNNILLIGYSMPSYLSLSRYIAKGYTGWAHLEACTQAHHEYKLNDDLVV